MTPLIKKTSSSTTTVNVLCYLLLMHDSRFRAREAYEILRPNEFTETFEIAEPGKDFETYSKNHFRRVGS